MSIFLDKNNIFYHGTRAKFDAFRPLSHFGSYQAAKKIIKYPYIKGELLDFDVEHNIYLTHNIENTMPVSNFYKIIPVQLNLHNTYELQDYASACSDVHYFMGEFLYHITNDLGLDKIPNFYDYIFIQPFNMNKNDVSRELARDNLYKPAKDNVYFSSAQIDCYHLCFQRMIQYFEHLGYDGFNYTNLHEDCGHTSYIVFRPENIIRQDVSVKFNDTPKHAGVNFDSTKMIKTRPITYAESEAIKKQNFFRYRYNDFKCNMFYVYPYLRYRKTLLKSAINSRDFYTKLFAEKILTMIKNIGPQQKYGEHGLYTHTPLVVQYAIEIAISVATDPMPVMLAAALHDIGRASDADGAEHCERSAQIATKFLTDNFGDMLPKTIDKIIGAIRNHTKGTIAPDLISACVWDANRIHKAWENGYEEKFFNTSYGKYIASLPLVANNLKPDALDIVFAKFFGRSYLEHFHSLSQKTYVIKQQKFMEQHNIKIH